MFPPNISFFLSRLLSVFTHPMTLFVLLALAILLGLAILKQPNNSTSVEESISLFYRHLSQKNWNMVWAHLSPKLRAELLNAQRPTIAKRGEAGMQQIEQMLAQNKHVFAQFTPRMISKHLVPLASEHLQMLMVHTRIAPGTPVVTLWLVRSLHSQGHWFIEEMLIHPLDKQGQPYTLSGKRFSKKEQMGRVENQAEDQAEDQTEDQAEDQAEDQVADQTEDQADDQAEDQITGSEGDSATIKSYQATTGSNKAIKEAKTEIGRA